jgi:S1-C subfamily serine protease
MLIFMKITAGSPADGVLRRGDVILEIDQRPISAFLHTEALELVQRAGGQVTFLLQRYDRITNEKKMLYMINMFVFVC